ncbi:MAG TPA: hypothetical protein VFX38_02885 [Gammaproteobacteria bacterium]|nr:hypothetical protein [Gammaproteobacteria bacterium]
MKVLPFPMREFFGNLICAIVSSPSASQVGTSPQALRHPAGRRERFADPGLQTQGIANKLAPATVSLFTSLTHFVNIPAS